MKSYSNDIVSSEKLQAQVDELKKREDKRYLITLVLIAVLAAATTMNAYVVFTAL